MCANNVRRQTRGILFGKSESKRSLGGLIADHRTIYIDFEGMRSENEYWIEQEYCRPGSEICETQ